jgi:hypothetical protein
MTKHHYFRYCTKPTFPFGWTRTYEDALLTCYSKGESSISKGKRVPASCPMTRPEIRAYVLSNGSSIQAVKTIRQERNCSLADAWLIFQKARGYMHLERNPYMEPSLREPSLRSVSS